MNNANLNLSPAIYHGGFTASCPVVGMQPVAPAGTDQSYTPLAVTARGFKVLSANAGTNVVAVMLDGSTGYWENVQAEYEYDGVIQAIVSSGTFNGSAVTTSASSVILLR